MPAGYGKKLGVRPRGSRKLIPVVGYVVKSGLEDAQGPSDSVCVDSYSDNGDEGNATTEGEMQ